MIVLHRRVYISGPADPQHSLVIDIDTIIMAQIVIEPPVAFIWALCMYFFNLVCQLLILRSSLSLYPASPFVVSGTGQMKQLTCHVNGDSMFFMALLNDCINLALSYFREASLLSVSSNFFSSVFSISERYSLCLSCSISI